MLRPAEQRAVKLHRRHEATLKGIWGMGREEMRVEK